MMSIRASRSSISLADERTPIETAEVVPMASSTMRPIHLVHRSTGSNTSSTIRAHSRASSTVIQGSHPTTPPTPALSISTTSSPPEMDQESHVCKSDHSSDVDDFVLEQLEPCYMGDHSIDTVGRAPLSSMPGEPAIFDAGEAFDHPQRKPLKVNPWKLTFNVVLAFGLIATLITGYAIGLSVFDLGVTSIGLYGVIVLSEYFFQVFSALWNRYDVNRIANQLKKKTSEVQTAGECEKGDQSTNGIMNPGREISIGIVGYREDEQAWRQCLRTLQVQTLAPKCIVGVVDGNEQPDLDMAEAFVSEFKSYGTESRKAPLIHLPILLSSLHFDTYMANIPVDTRFRLKKYSDWFTGHFRPGHAAALSIARHAVIAQVLDWDKKWKISSLNAVVFSQPHGHKRTALFTAFAFNMYVIRTRDAIFTTDSDTIMEANALDEMMALMSSGPQIGGITAGVKIWNRGDNFLTRLCSTRYWFAFNIERACQSIWGCVSCLSGPIALYRACDLDNILGPWNLQTFGGKHTTFGDDRHLTNQILGQGLQTRYTHRTWCDSESPKTFVRWIAQQTRWTKSFFREAFWFPKSFAYHHPWMLLEMSIHTLYPFFLLTTCFHLLFDPKAGHKMRPVVWLVTIFGLAFVKSLVALIIEFDPWLLLFAFYGFIHFFGLLPTKLWALVTLNSTGWGTGARSATERKKHQTFLQRTFLVGHLVVWFAAVFTGIGFFVYKMFDNPLFLLITIAMVLMTIYLYWDSDKFSDKFREVRDKAVGWTKRKKLAPAPGHGNVLFVDASTPPNSEKPSENLSLPSEKHSLSLKSLATEEKVVSDEITSVLSNTATSTSKE